VQKGCRQRTIGKGTRTQKNAKKRAGMSAGKSMKSIMESILEKGFFNPRLPTSGRDKRDRANGIKAKHGHPVAKPGDTTIKESGGAVSPVVGSGPYKL